MLYTYCLVKPEGHNETYYYLSDISDLSVGEYVTIPFGYKNKKIIGKIVTVEHYSQNDKYPYPPSKTKRIIDKYVMEDYEGYNLCIVKPITHKQKTFNYLSKIENLKAGDYVDIPFGKYNEVRIAQIIHCEKYDKNRHPLSFQNNKFVIRLLTEANSDYVGFIIRWNGSHIINPVTDRPVNKHDFKDCTIETYYDIINILSVTNNLNGLSIPFRMHLLKTYDKYYTGWNSKHHKYDINPLVTIEEVNNFEKAYNITLPADYVNFITQVGNGLLHIYPLDIWNHHLKYHYLKYDNPLDLANNHIHLDYHENLMCDNNEIECYKCNLNKNCTFSDYVDYYDIIDARYHLGTLPVCYSGCTYTDRLITSGKYAGTVWLDSETYFVKIADNFTSYVNDKINSELAPVIEYFKMIAEKKSSDEIINSLNNFDNGYVDPLLLCGALNIDIPDSQTDSRQFILKTLKNRIEQIYNTAD